jgi:adenine phosphoribosyltransferase
MDAHQIRALIRDVPDFPRPGVLFRDITTVLQDPVAWRRTIELLADAVGGLDVDVVLGIESRGFVLGAPLSIALGTGFVPARKAGRLPSATHSVGYQLEYGVDDLEIHQDAIAAGSRVLVVDDLLATGGTAAAATELIAAGDAVVAGYAFLIELEELGGRARLDPGSPAISLVTY